MVILDEKQMLPPPPPYVQNTGNGYAPRHISCRQLTASSGPPPFPGYSARDPPTLITLPPHLLLHVVHQTLPVSIARLRGGEDRVERQRKTLYWMATSLRLVCRSLYIACMHVLRSTYLPAYTSRIRSPYTSDPFPYSAPSVSSPSSSTASSSILPSPLNAVQRETAVLDLFLAVKVREDVWLDDTELHLEREESFRDLFDLMQPRARLEDLVRVYGVREGVVSAGPAASFAPASPKNARFSPIPFSSLSVSFSSRLVGLILLTKGAKRTIVETVRGRDEKLEVAAKSLIHELRLWLESR